MFNFSASQVCLYIVKIWTNILEEPIELKSSNPNSVIVGSNVYTGEIGSRISVIDTNYYLKVVLDDKISIDWNRGLTIRIEVSSDYLNRTAGICGRFDGKSNDDRLGRDGLHKTTLTELAQSWNEEEGECKVSDDHETGTKCEEV